MLIYKYLLRMLIFVLSVTLVACSGDSDNSGLPIGTCSISSFPVLAVGLVTPDGSNIFTNRQISLTFNNCLNIRTINKDSFFITGALNPTTKINGKIKYRTNTTSTAPNVLIFQPIAPFMPANDTITITVTTAVKGFAGEQMPFNFTETFSTGANADTNSPTTMPSVPAGYYNTTQFVDLECNDTAGSEGDLVAGTGCDQTFYSIDGTIPSITSTRYTGSAITLGEFAPVNEVTPITLQYFSTDLADNAEAVVSQVYIIDKVQPTVQSVTLEDSTDISVDTVIEASFDEEMLASTFNASTIVIDNGVTATYRFDNATQTLTISPLERLACNTVHNVTLETGLTDLAGNNLATSKSWSFKTTSDCSEPVTTADIAGGVYTTIQNVILSCSDADSTCARLVYTLDGSIPSFSPANGTIVDTVMSGPITIGVGDTLLRYYSEDSTGHREVVREQLYSISNAGFTFAATQNGLARGVGAEPDSYININAAGVTLAFFTDSSNNRIYRGTVNGLYSSDNDGATWRALGLTIRVNVVHATGYKIIVGTDAGLMTSLDGGASFLREALTGEYINDVIIQGKDVFVANGNGVSISNDKGVSFSRRTTANGLGSNNVYDIALDGDTIYAATSNGLSISTTRDGTIFDNRDTTNSNIADDRVRAIEVDATTIYVGTEAGLSTANKNNNSLYTSASGLSNLFVRTLMVDGNNVYVGMGDPRSSAPTPSFSISMDGGLNFVNKRIAPTSASTDVDNNAFMVKDGTLYIAAHPGYYTSTDNGDTLTMGAIPFNTFYHITGDGARLYAAAYDGSGFGGILTSTDGGTTFSFSSMEQGLGDERINDLFVDGARLYATLFSPPNSGLYFSDSNGTSFTSVPNAPSPAETVFASGNDIYLGTSGSLQRSTDGGGMFSPLFSPTGLAKDVVVSGPNIYLATSGEGVYVSNDSGITAPVLKTTADGLTENATKSVTVDGNSVYVGTLNNGLSKSTDNGGTFSAVTALSTGGINALHVFATRLYAGTTNGIAISSDAGNSFSVKTTADGLGSNVITDVFYDAP